MNRIMEEMGHFKDLGTGRGSTSSFNQYYLFAYLTSVYGAAMCQALLGTRDLIQSDWVLSGEGEVHSNCNPGKSAK